MSSASSFVPIFDDTLRYSTRAPVFFSSWWKWIVWSRTAVYAFTGTLTRPKLIEPLHVARGMPRGVPARAIGEPRGDTGGMNALRRASCGSTARRRCSGSSWRRTPGSSSCPGSCATPITSSPNCTQGLMWDQTEVLRYDHYVPREPARQRRANRRLPAAAPDRPAPSIALPRPVHGRRRDPLPRRPATSRVCTATAR